MTKQMLKGIRAKSKEELAERIYKYFEEVNAAPVIYRWTYKLDEITIEEAKDNIAIVNAFNFFAKKKNRETQAFRLAEQKCRTMSQEQ